MCALTTWHIRGCFGRKGDILMISASRRKGGLSIQICISRFTLVVDNDATYGTALRARSLPFGGEIVTFPDYKDCLNR